MCWLPLSQGSSCNTSALSDSLQHQKCVTFQAISKKILNKSQWLRFIRNWLHKLLEIRVQHQSQNLVKMQKMPAAKPWALTFMPESLHLPQCIWDALEKGKARQPGKVEGRFLSAGLPRGGFGLRMPERMQENILGPPVEALVTHPDLSTSGSARVLTQPWLRGQRCLCESPPPAAPNVFLGVPQTGCAPCVCPFHP